ncbi:hypothetical protein F4803DRAFT_572685 [Xylaria telfairii]|nr:hypothetical protein F4803DRAFT_572685 [Xylaria telfairii]
MASRETTVLGLPNPTRVITTTNLDDGVSSFDTSFDESLGPVQNPGGSIIRLAYVSNQAPQALNGSDLDRLAKGGYRRCMAAQLVLVQTVDTPSTAATIRRLGQMLEGRRETKYSRAVKGETKLGAGHLDTLTSMANLASTYRNQGRSANTNANANQLWGLTDQPVDADFDRWLVQEHHRVKSQKDNKVMQNFIEGLKKTNIELPPIYESFEAFTEYADKLHAVENKLEVLSRLASSLRFMCPDILDLQSQSLDEIEETMDEYKELMTEIMRQVHAVPIEKKREALSYC